MALGGGTAQARRRAVQQTRDQKMRRLLRIAAGFRQGLGTLILEMTAQVRHQRPGVTFTLSIQKRPDLVIDNPTGGLGLGPPPDQAFHGDAFQIAEVIDISIVQVMDRRIDVTGHGRIDNQNGPAAPCLQRLGDQVFFHDPPAVAQGRDDHIGFRHPFGQILEHIEITAQYTRRAPGAPFAGMDHR